MILLFALILGIGVSALVLSFSLMLEISDEESLEAELERIQEQSLLYLNNQSTLLEKEATLLAQSPIISTVLIDGDPPTILDTLRGLEKELQVEEIDVLDEDGKWFGGTRIEFHKTDSLAFQSLLEAALQGESAKGIVKDEDHIELISMAAVGDIDADEIWGVLVLRQMIHEKFLREMSDLLGVDITLLNNDKVLASSLPKKAIQKLLEETEPAKITKGWSGSLQRTFGSNPYVQHRVGLHDWNGKKVADLDIVGSLAKTQKTLGGFFQLSFVIGFGVFILGTLGCILFSLHITRPLQSLTRATERVREGDYSAEIEENGTGEIGNLSRGFRSMIQTIHQSQSALKELNLTLEERVHDRTIAIRNLLNFAGQGFLSFDSTMSIQPDFSHECEEIFGEQIQPGVNVCELLFQPGEEREEFQTWMEQAFGELVAFDLITRLSPNSFYRQGQTFKLEYKKIPYREEHHVMCILTDITEQKELEAQNEENKNQVKMTLRVLSSSQLFVEFRSQLKEMIRREKELFSNHREFKAVVHTLKGNAATFCLHDLKSTLHKLDLALHEEADLLTLRLLFEEVEQSFEDTMLDLRLLLKDQVDWDEVCVRVPRRIVTSALNVMSFKDLPEIKELCSYSYPYFRSLFGHVHGLLEDLLIDTDKQIGEVRIVGGEFPINPEPYTELLGNLVHIFRNIVDHGLESVLEREAHSKESEGKIGIFLDRGTESILMKIQDDGRGIDPEKISKRMVEKNLKSQEEVEKMSSAEVLNSIFLQGISSADEINEISGLGIGLAAVRACVEKMGGSINVGSRLGIGTTFKIEVPYYC